MQVNGAGALIKTLVDSGVTTCFMNPGTSEMHFVAALDEVPEMHSILALFEGVATGAADGYARMTGKPAATLLHLGPGLGNGIANLHNARRAHSPLVNIVGDHATYHHQYDAPLESDVKSLAMNVSGWFQSSTTPDEVALHAAQAVRASYGPPGQVATLLLPADLAWSQASGSAKPLEVPPRPKVSAEKIKEIAQVLESGEPTALIVGGNVLRLQGLELASAVSKKSGAKLLAETFPARLERGSGIPPVERLGYLAEFVVAQLSGIKHIILVDAKAPVSFFAYPNQPSDLVPEGATLHTLSELGHDAIGALSELGDMIGASEPILLNREIPGKPTGSLNAEKLAAAIASTMIEDLIISDESNTGGIFIAGATAGGPPHDVLTLTGGAIGQGMPVATGAAVGAKGRRVLSLQADGSALYTFQSLWTQAREGLDVTTVILDNRRYAILEMELSRVGAGSPGPIALGMLDISNPDMNFLELAKGLGVPATRAETAEELSDAISKSYATEGPHLIHAVLPEGIGY
ncbi:MAG: acetolactate synthase large subunit [Acidimicrobiales bacterium]|nr:acetolactate synthase large subunit [Acidimicrobiales bacterium]